MSNKIQRCGYVAIIGRPNVGKSTLINHILGRKISITSRKPQTTRHTLLGIRTDPGIQMIFVDTPGIHSNQDRTLNRIMNRSAVGVIKDVDVVIFLVDRTDWSDEDEYVAKYLTKNQAPLIVAINKIDSLKDKSSLLPYLDFLSQKLSAVEFVPISALRQINIGILVERIKLLLPENQF